MAPRIPRRNTLATTVTRFALVAATASMLTPGAWAGPPKGDASSKPVDEAPPGDSENLESEDAQTQDDPSTPPSEAPEDEGAPTSDSATESTEPEPPDVDPARAAELEQRARSLQDRLFQARARVSVVASKLFNARLELELKSNLERFYTVGDFVLSVDGAPVFTRESGLPPTTGALFELFAAPGPHQIGVSVDLMARRDPSYKTRLHQTFTVMVPAERTVSTRLVLRETGNMWRFAKRGRGYYRTVVRLHARAKKNRGSGRAPATVSADATGEANR